MSSKGEKKMKGKGKFHPDGHSTRTNLPFAFMGWEVTAGSRSSEENRDASSGGICMGRFISAAEVAGTFQLGAPSTVSLREEEALAAL